jgi:hypothetical protein
MWLRKIESMRLLFPKKGTENVMDYKGGNYDYLFKWQWKPIHTVLTQYESSNWGIK